MATVRSRPPDRARARRGPRRPPAGPPARSKYLRPPGPNCRATSPRGDPTPLLASPVPPRVEDARLPPAIRERPPPGAASPACARRGHGGPCAPSPDTRDPRRQHRGPHGQDPLPCASRATAMVRPPRRRPVERRRWCARRRPRGGRGGCRPRPRRRRRGRRGASARGEACRRKARPARGRRRSREAGEAGTSATAAPSGRRGATSATGRASTSRRGRRGKGDGEGGEAAGGEAEGGQREKSKGGEGGRPQGPRLDRGSGRSPSKGPGLRAQARAEPVAAVQGGHLSPRSLSGQYKLHDGMIVTGPISRGYKHKVQPDNA